MTTSPHDAHPLVVAYLADLDRALAGTDPHERADTVAAIREHIDDALDGAPQDTATTMAVLADLGPVERIAATATPAAAALPVAPAPAPTHEGRSMVLLGCAVFSLFLVFALPWVAAPIAVGTLIVTVLHLRRSGGGERYLRAAAVLSIATIIVAALLATLLLSTGDNGPSPDDVVPVESSAE